MARSDRLFRLLDAIRRLPQPVTAARLAEDTGVSLRTLYRDIDTLRAAGARIEGEAGYGYTMTEDPALPPQQFTRLEVEAIALGLMEMQQSGDGELAAAAGDAMAKLVARLPERRQREALHATFHLFRTGRRDAPEETVRLLRRAAWDERAVDIAYADAEGRATERRILPLALVYLDQVMMVPAWCCLREDYREFRVDRVISASLTEVSFRPRRVPMLRAFVEARVPAPG